MVNIHKYVCCVPFIGLIVRSFYSFTVYFGSSIYIGAVPEVVERYGISIEVSSLALALYVFGCEFIIDSNFRCYLVTDSDV